jgi:hypothetical protein
MLCERTPGAQYTQGGWPTSFHDAKSGACPTIAMTSAEGISKHGFRGWYERQLIEGHVYFVTWFLSLILVVACPELIDWRQPLREQCGHEWRMDNR